MDRRLLAPDEQTLMPYQAQGALDGDRFLVLAPHPDDEVFGCGGTLANLARLGRFVQVVICTDGAGRSDNKEKTTQLRESESLAAAQLLGLKTPPLFLRLPDRGLCSEQHLAARIQELIRSHQCDCVLAPSTAEIHPDHRALALMSAQAVMAEPTARTLYHYEVGAALQPDLLIDISQSLELKNKAIACFESELAHQRYDQHIQALNLFRTYTLPPKVAAAEAFRRFSREDLLRDPTSIFYNEANRWPPQAIDALDELSRRHTPSSGWVRRFKRILGIG